MLKSLFDVISNLHNMFVAFKMSKPGEWDHAAFLQRSHDERTFPRGLYCFHPEYADLVTIEIHGLGTEVNFHGGKQPLVSVV